MMDDKPRDASPMRRVTEQELRAAYPNVDPRLSLPLTKPGILRAKRMALTFVPDDADGKMHKAEIDINPEVIAEMLTKLRTGKVRLQIVSGFGGERDFIFENGAELIFFSQLMESFIMELPS